MELPLGVAIGLLVGLVFFSALCITRAGSLAKAWWGMTLAGKALKDPALDAKLNALLGQPVTAPPTTPPVPTPAAPAKPTGDALRLLTLLQAESRLIDFLLEDISAATDAQIGTGARKVHDEAAAVLKKYLALEPVLKSSEGEKVTVPMGFDPSSIRVVGNVSGTPPFTGEVQHPGWRVTELKLPGVPSGQDLFVLQPAEVQV
jgi:hypothetical protein